VTYATSKGVENTVTIVGIDEANTGHGLVSWVSPVAKVLLKAREGDVLRLRTPAGEETLDVLEIRYDGP
jgi:transcription elongation factor GreB